MEKDNEGSLRTSHALGVTRSRIQASAKPQRTWMPDRVRHDGKKLRPKKRWSILFSYLSPGIFIFQRNLKRIGVAKGTNINRPSVGWLKSWRVENETFPDTMDNHPGNNLVRDIIGQCRPGCRDGWSGGLAASSVPAASDQPLPLKIFLPAILSASDGR